MLQVDGGVCRMMSYDVNFIFHRVTLDLHQLENFTGRGLRVPHDIL